MKQFVRCANCRQWYVERAVTTVDILQDNGMRRMAMWCRSCIREAEQRSLYADEDIDCQDWQAAEGSLLSRSLLTPEDASGAFGDLMQEHLALMEEALLEEDDSAIASRIRDFIDRGRVSLEQLDDAAQAQRLTAHLNYWQTVLKALRP